MMKSKHVILLFLFILSVALYSCGNDSRKGYNPISLYFSPTEDYLFNYEVFPDFINYPDDWAKFGLKGNVKEFQYKTLHNYTGLFKDDGKLQAKVFIASGGGNKELSSHEYIYDNDGYLTQVKSEGMIDFGRGKGFSSAGKKVDTKVISNTTSGKPQIRAINDLNRNVVDYIIHYEYDANDICRGVRLADNSPNKKNNAIVCKFDCNEKGQITYIHTRRTRIPYRLTLGERKITPSYDSNGRLVAMNEISIPHNMEAYRIDSIASTTNYKYNKQGDIIECKYSDIVYPGNVTKDFILTFSYEYDNQGNWIKKYIKGDIADLNAAMNSYYRDSYAINRIEDENDKTLGEIVLEREITYFENTGKVVKTNQKNIIKEPKVKIQATTGFISEAKYDLKRITNAERKELCIDAIEDLKTNSNRVIAKGKEIYKDENGRIETILVIWEEQAILEYLASYDASGNVIDCIIIGADYYYGGDDVSASIEGNTIRKINSWCDPGYYCEEGIDQIYTITDALYLIPFSWPAQSFPVEIPFMMHRTEGSGYYYKIESVVCTHISGNQFEFVLKGKTIQDCRSLKSDERTFMLVPLGKEAAPAGESIKVVMPAINENDTFEIKAKGLSKDKVDETIFTCFRIQL